jgi:hypothetical protein
MIDGLNILGKREENYSDFIDVLKQFPNCFFKCFSLILEDLTKRQNNCIIQVEQYVYENESRYNWEFKKNLIYEIYIYFSNLMNQIDEKNNQTNIEKELL